MASLEEALRAVGNDGQIGDFLSSEEQDKIFYGIKNESDCESPKYDIKSLQAAASQAAAAVPIDKFL